MKTPSLFVVIPVLNRWDQTRHCLERLAGGRQPPTHIIVVDHGSTDGTRAGLMAHFPRVTYLEDDPAHWWAGATNAGIREALKRGAENLILLNNDCYVKPDTLATLLGHAERNPGTIIAPVQRHLNGDAVCVVRASSCFLAGYPTMVLPWHTRHVGEPRLLRSRVIIGGRGVLIPRQRVRAGRSVRRRTLAALRGRSRFLFALPQTRPSLVRCRRRHCGAG